MPSKSAPQRPASASQGTADDPTMRRAENDSYYRDILHDLIEIGMNVARGIGQEAEARQDVTSQGGEGPNLTPDLTIPFDRIARSIRRTIMLAQKLAEHEAQREAAGLPAVPAGQDRVAARRRILRDVEDAISDKAAGPQAERLKAELAERLDAPDIEDDITARPISDIVAEICRDLGVAGAYGYNPWKRRTPSDVAALCARAARPFQTVEPLDDPAPQRPRQTSPQRPPEPPPQRPLETSPAHNVGLPPPRLIETPPRPG